MNGHRVLAMTSHAKAYCIDCGRLLSAEWLFRRACAPVAKWKGPAMTAGRRGFDSRPVHP